MRCSIILAVSLVSLGYARQAKADSTQDKEVKHEASENKSRTVAGGASKGVKACHADIEKWCKDVQPGEGRLGACLKEHVKSLSKPCRRWASHGGKSHIEEALLKDLDGAPPAKTN